MYSGACALICGTLAENIKIYKNSKGRQYGIALIAVNQKLSNSKKLTKPATKAHSLPVHIWHKKLLDKSALLKKGEQIWIVGELEFIEDKERKSKVITINVKQASGITLLSKMPAHFEKSKN